MAVQGRGVGSGGTAFVSGSTTVGRGFLARLRLRSGPHIFPGLQPMASSTLHRDGVCSDPASGLELERWAPSDPMAVITGVELAKKGSIQLCPGIIIHCGMVNRCHEAQQLAKHMKPKFPSFAGFSIYFLVDFAS